MEQGKDAKGVIQTRRLRLIPCNREYLEILISGEAALAAHLSVDLADNWLIFRESVPYSLQMIDDDPRAEEWGMHLFVYIPDNKLIGCGGYKGAPDAGGMVEFGYSVAPSYENRGLASEAARALVDRAFADRRVQIVDAHTLAEWNASTTILQKCGLAKIGEKHDPDDGDIWHWRLARGDHC
jgi:[ribosomal protein S5]-alanine N-acetyltransferase